MIFARLYERLFFQSPKFFYFIIYVYVLGEGLDCVKLEELLVEESWVKVLPGELEKPYGKKLCKFVESEIKGSGVPIYPPQHLIFNALNTTTFDAVKVVIIGQVIYEFLLIMLLNKLLALVLLFSFFFR